MPPLEKYFVYFFRTLVVHHFNCNLNSCDLRFSFFFIWHKYLACTCYFRNGLPKLLLFSIWDYLLIRFTWEKVVSWKSVWSLKGPNIFLKWKTNKHYLFLWLFWLSAWTFVFFGIVVCVAVLCVFFGVFVFAFGDDGVFVSFALTSACTNEVF